VDDENGVVDIADYRPHVTLTDPYTGNVTVLPAELMRKWIKNDPTVPPPDAQVIRAALWFMMLELDLMDDDDGSER
jgi:hypothetical protein